MIYLANLGHEKNIIAEFKSVVYGIVYGIICRTKFQYNATNSLKSIIGWH